MSFNDEKKFEEELIELLTEHGWKEGVLRYKTAKDLEKNWADILYENNNTKDLLNGCPLTDTEMKQIIRKIEEKKTPLELHEFINGGFLRIVRDNEEDKDNYGKEISLKIYDRYEIAGGHSRYQIVEQPQFGGKDDYPSRRGDFMLLINGMPLYHVELKRSGIPVSKAWYQIRKYMREGVFTGIFSLVQIFVAMTPEETVYFANPGSDEAFNEKYLFHWANFDNRPMNNYKDIATNLLNIPMAHQLIGSYMVPDKTDGVLKVMRSYQYYAANIIADRVTKIAHGDETIYGGYISHTTGSGKTMTSFQAACLIADSGHADKVVFLMDRIELSTQSLREYRGFADALTDVQDTENTHVLINKLKSKKPENTLIVTSVQKMSNINEEGKSQAADIAAINKKRLVFIVDECHRSTFGEMLATIKNTFPRAIFFGFTGTPIEDENKKKNMTTAMVFGDELHRYSISDGIKDGNVLGFDPVKVSTYKDQDLRRSVALEKARASSTAEALANPEKKKIYDDYMNPEKVPMVRTQTKSGELKGIEDYIPNAQYNRREHREAVLTDILDNWVDLSKNNKYHAILATSSIEEAIEYYRLLKEKRQQGETTIKFTALFDPTIDNKENDIGKEEALLEILEDYNRNFKTNYPYSQIKLFKKDLISRLAHKGVYQYLHNEPAENLNLLIVVDQMLTGFDSKWVNTLYMDKILEYEKIIQAFSRTNRIAEQDKPHGIIRYYRKPHTTEQDIYKAFQLYSGGKPFGVFVDKLPVNLRAMNEIFTEIKDIYESAGLKDFEHLPEDPAEVKKFAELFNKFNKRLESAKVQLFKWGKKKYDFKKKTGEEYSIIPLFDEMTYETLLQRYVEIPRTVDKKNEDLAYEIDYYLTENRTGIINAEWINARFKKYSRAFPNGENVAKLKADLSQSFATLPIKSQKYANLVLHDIESGDILIDPNKDLVDYINEYGQKAREESIKRIVVNFGLDERLLRQLLKKNVNKNNINHYGRFKNLMKTVNMELAGQYVNNLHDGTLEEWNIPIQVEKDLLQIILNFDE